MSTPRLAALLAAAALLAVVADHALSSPATTARAATAGRSGNPFLRFSGTGTATVRPDEATIDLSTSGRGVSLADATNQASAAMTRVIAAMRKDGVQAADMQTSQATGGRDAHGADPWLARQSLTVTVRRTAQTGKLISDAISAGATATSGPEFSQSDQQAGQAQAIARAVANARAEADAAAAAASLRVTGVISITESGGGYPLYAAAGPALDGARGAATPVPVQRGSQQVSASVTVTFSVASA
jgi:uncharacterized protein